MGSRVINWNEVSAVVVAITALMAIGGFAVRAMIREEMAKLDYRFQRLDLAEDRHTEINRRLEHLESHR